MDHLCLGSAYEDFYSMADSTAAGRFLRSPDTQLPAHPHSILQNRHLHCQWYPIVLLHLPASNMRSLAGENKTPKLYYVFRSSTLF
jgi:hypothetical protein